MIAQPTPSYEEFLAAKMCVAPFAGFEVDISALSDWLAPHCKAIVPWALKGGRRAIFASFGLHKTSIQLELMRQVKRQTGGPTLIVAPLNVRAEFYDDAGTMGISIKFIRSIEEIDPGIDVHITNYETVRDGKLDPALFAGASLDEASCLRSYGSKTYQEFLPLFADVPYRFVATATPSPNRYKELIHYAGFLGIMDTGQALTRFFQRNSEKAGDLTLYPHKTEEFWMWVASWAIFITSPSDLGFSDEGYVLPEMVVRYHKIDSNHASAEVERDGQGALFRNSAKGIVEASREKRNSLEARIAKMAEICAADPDSHRVLWHNLEDERRAIEAAIPGVVTVYGTLDMEVREQRVVDFKEGRIKNLGTKPELNGSGSNFQRHCHKAIFAGIDYDFNDFIQAIFRIQRFGQKFTCEIDIIYTEAEQEVLREMLAKWARHDQQRAVMREIIKKYGLSHAEIAASMHRSIGVERIEASGELFTIARNDCVLEAASRPENTVGLIVTSIPFSNHYEYTPSYNDFGHTDNNDHFWVQMDFLTPQLLRILQPGRMACIHVKDRILFGNVTGQGVPTISPFHAETLMHMRKHGFQLMAMITVVTDVVRENNQTYRLGYSEMLKDGTKMGTGSPEYVIIARKPQSDKTRGYADVPVTKDPAEYSLARWQVDAHAFWRSSGNRLLSPEELAELKPNQITRLFTDQSLRQVYDHRAHAETGDRIEQRRKGALPRTFMSLAPGSHNPDVWHDVNRMLTLNGAQSAAGREQHVCLARGSLVLTRHGYKEIQLVQVGDQVLTHRGRWRPVVTVLNTGIKPAVTLQAQGVCGLTLTPEHKLWTRPVRDLPWSRNHSKREAMGASPMWVRADATPGSYINLKLPDVETADVIDPSVWWIVGRWIADGHWGGRGEAVISCGRHETKRLLRRLGERAGSVRDTGTSHQIYIKDRNRSLRAVLDQCGRGAAGKQLPPSAITLPVQSARALLEGYLSGDGHLHADRQRWTASSISKQLMFGIAMLAQRVHGAIASIYPGRPAGTAKIQGRSVKTRQDWVMCFDLPRKDARKPMLLDDGAWKKVRAAVPTGEVETWCLQVAEDESFTAEGCIVHNCPLQFDIVDRLIERYSNKGDLVYDPFGGLMTVPYRAIKLGRRGGASELHEDYFRDGLRYLEAAEREAALPSLFDLMDGEKAA